VGNVSEKVLVQAEAPVINTESGAIGIRRRGDPAIGGCDPGIQDGHEFLFGGIRARQRRHDGYH
jgi:hypothetical protein